VAFAAHLIIDGKPEFGAMESYYRTFPHEKSTKMFFNYDLTPPVRIKDATFEKLLDKMIDMRQASAAIDNFVIVCHGLHDKNDFGWGLAMPVADGSQMKCSYEVLEPLIKLRDSGGAPDEFEKNYTYSNASLGVSNAKHSPGSVARLIAKMTQLQQLKVRIVEFRACTLGTNVPGLTLVGQSFGARFVVAPDVHMFYVNAGVTRGFNTPANFVKLLPKIPRARKFENPSNNSEKLAIEIMNGAGVTYNSTALTNTVNLKWFVDTKLWPLSNYVNGGSSPRDFFMEGMDLHGGDYALPQEQKYCDHLVEAGPLKGNLI
jgi:hypothetical protein